MATEYLKDKVNAMNGNKSGFDSYTSVVKLLLRRVDTRHAVWEFGGKIGAIMFAGLSVMILRLMQSLTVMYF